MLMAVTDTHTHTHTCKTARTKEATGRQWRRAQGGSLSQAKFDKSLKREKEKLFCKSSQIFFTYPPWEPTQPRPWLCCIIGQRFERRPLLLLLLWLVLPFVSARQQAARCDYNNICRHCASRRHFLFMMAAF